MSTYLPNGVGAELHKLLKPFSIFAKPCTERDLAQALNRSPKTWITQNKEKLFKRYEKANRFDLLPFSKEEFISFLDKAIETVTPTDPSHVFEKIFCVSLDRREDRWNEFINSLPSDWNLGEIIRYPAIDGRLVKPPSWWRQGAGAWGCYKSHLNLIEHCLNNKISSVLLLEDDAICCENFGKKIKNFFDNLPQHWEMVYLGGQHLKINQKPPIKISEHIYQPYNVNRTHAFGMRGAMLSTVYKHLLRKDWQKGHHIDHHLGRLHQIRKNKIYCPKEWLIGQREGKSNISGREHPTKFWQNAEVIAKVDPRKTPFIAVLGLHSSGSSCLAGVLYHLGLHLGNDLTGYYGSNPEKACGFEAVGLRDICELVVPFPSLEYKIPKGKRWGLLRGWINQKRREAYNQNTIAAGKYPQLSLFKDQLLNICGENLYIISSERKLEESIQSIIKRCPKKDPSQLEDHQKWIAQEREVLINLLPSQNVLRVSYENLLTSPKEEIEKILNFLPLSKLSIGSPEQIEKALTSINPTKRNVIL